MTDSKHSAGQNPVSGFNTLSILERRKIEIQIMGPILRAFIKKFGELEATDTTREVIKQIARDQGSEFAKFIGSNSLMDFSSNKDPWQKGNALEIDELQINEKEYSFNVTRCRYAEMYHDLGYGDLGKIFSCSRDFEFSTGFNSKIKLQRTQTIMEGFKFCDFRYRYD